MAGRGRPSRATACQRLDRALAGMHQRLDGLPSHAGAQSIWDDIWHAEAHHSTALEGSTLVLREVRPCWRTAAPPAPGRCARATRSAATPTRRGGFTGRRWNPAAGTTAS